MISADLLCPPVWPISEGENPKRDQINQRNEYHDRPERRESDSAENTAHGIDNHRDHYNEPKPMDRAEAVPIHPAIHHLSSPVELRLRPPLSQDNSLLCWLFDARQPVAAVTIALLQRGAKVERARKAVRQVGRRADLQAGC